MGILIKTKSDYLQIDINCFKDEAMVTLNFHCKPGESLNDALARVLPEMYKASEESKYCETLTENTDIYDLHENYIRKEQLRLDEQRKKDNKKVRAFRRTW